MNRGAVERAIRFGPRGRRNDQPPSIFARKNYFYPDLPKGYQISQYEMPVVQGGTFVHDSTDGKAKETVSLTRAHLEEDAGKSLHEDFHGMTGIDLNRAGTPSARNRLRAGNAQRRRSGRLCKGAAFAGTLARHLRRQHAGRLVPLRRQRVGATAGRTSSAPAARSRT